MHRVNVRVQPMLLAKAKEQEECIRSRLSSRGMMEKLRVRFSADTSLLKELGERLVSRPSIALAELVKNSFDADGTLVILKFIRVTKPGGEIIVEDDGEGMTFDVFKRAWMKIATDEKIRNPLSRRFRRHRTGSKGVGRFACLVLARKLVLESIAFNNGKCERILADFDWESYETGKDVTEISVTCLRESLSKARPTGTTLTLRDTRAGWNESELSDLRRDIISLVTPFPWEPKFGKLRQIRGRDPGFEVKFEAPEFPDFEGPASRRILENSWGVLEGHVDKTGLATYDLKETKGKKCHRFTALTRFLKVGEAPFTIYYFVYKKEHYPGVEIGLREMQRLGRSFGGVRVYLDDFRVFRYGEPGDDWLQLEFDRSRRVTGLPEELSDEAELAGERPKLLLPGNNQLFGAVFLSRSSNPNIDVTIARDRLLDNEASKELRRFVRLGIDWMNLKYAAATAEARSNQRERKEDPLELLERTRTNIVEHEKELGSATGQILTLLDRAKSAVAQQKEQMITDLAMLRVLASTGTMISILEHDLVILLSDVRFDCAKLRRYSSLLPPTTASEFSTTVDVLEDWINSVERESSLLGLLLGREARQQRRRQALRQITQQLIDGFSHHLKEFGIEPDIQVPAALRTPPIFRCELASILLNLLTNSIKAVKSQQVRKVLVRASESNTEFEMQFLDTGPGVSPDRRQEVFLPFRSTSEPDPVFGQGTGLGLSIVRDIVLDYGGKVAFTDPPREWGACVRIMLPKTEDQD
jgi:signal transduction histidine kinase